MRITKKWLKKHNACSGGVVWVLKQKNKNEFILAEKALEEGYFNWVNWAICKRLNKMKEVQYAVFAAKQVLSIFEKKYPKDNRPRKAIEAAEKHLKDSCNRTKITADAEAAAYVDAATYDAAAATYAAAAAYAAEAAAKAAAAETAAADAAAYATYARRKIQKTIINYGIQLIKGGTK